MARPKDADKAATWNRIVAAARRELFDAPGGVPDVSVRKVSISPARPRIGGRVSIGFTLVNKLAKRQRVMADLVVHFVKARGTGAKTFKLKAVDLPPRGSVTLGKKIALKQLTTRKHYPGAHRVELLLNGRRVKLGQFALTPAA